MRPLPDRQKSDRAPTPRWRIFRIWGGAKAFIGIVAAADQESAITKAIAQFEITDPEHQRRLVAEVRY
jgi:hypothetical protein